MSKNPPKDIADRDPKKVAFGERVRTIREQRGFTQKQLGAMIGVEDNSITQYETGRAFPRQNRFQRLVEALGVSSSYLLTGDNPDELVRAQTNPELEAITIIRALPADQQEVALAALRALSSALTKKK